MFQTILIEPLANGLILFYRILGSNLGVAIIVFSVFLRVLLNPLTKPYIESMKKIKDIAPHLEKLKKKHKDDKVKLAQAQSELYKQKGVNPGAGCVPYILQIIVLIAFFNMFTRTLSSGPDPTLEFNKLLYEPLKFAETVKINTRFLYLDISKPDVFNFSNIKFPVPGPLLIIAAIVQFASAKIMAPYEKVQEKISKKTPQASDDIQVAMQKSMIYTFPLMTLFIGVRFPSGLALYWLVFSLTQAYQQYKTQGWGGLTPFIIRLGLIKSSNVKN